MPLPQPVRAVCWVALSFRLISITCIIATYAVLAHIVLKFSFMSPSPVVFSTHSVVLVFDLYRVWWLSRCLSSKDDCYKPRKSSAGNTATFEFLLLIPLVITFFFRNSYGNMDGPSSELDFDTYYDRERVVFPYFMAVFALTCTLCVLRGFLMILCIPMACMINKHLPKTPR